MVKKKLYISSIVILLFLCILFRGPTLFNIFPSNISGIRVNYILLLLAAVIMFILNNFKIHLKTGLIYLFFLIIIFTHNILSQTFNVEYLIYFMQILLSYYVLSGLINKIKRDNLLKTLSIGIYAVIFMSIYEILTGNLLFHSSTPYEINNITSYNRAYLFFYNGNNLSLFILSVYFLTLGYNINKNKYVDLLIQFVLCSFIFLINDSKISLATIIIFTSIILITKFKNDFQKQNWFSLIFGFSVISICLIITISYINKNKRFINIFIENANTNISNDPRINLYEDAISTFFDYPWGIGIGQSDVYFSTNIHSIIFQVIVEIGIFGLLLWIFYYGLILNIRFDRLKKEDKLIANIVKSSLLLFPILSMQISRLISDNALIMLWMLFLSLFVYYTKNKRQQTKEII